MLTNNFCGEESILNRRLKMDSWMQNSFCNSIFSTMVTRFLKIFIVCKDKPYQYIKEKN